MRDKLSWFFLCAVLVTGHSCVYADAVSDANAAFAASLDARKFSAAKSAVTNADEIGQTLAAQGVTSVIVTLRQPRAFRTMKAGDWSSTAGLRALHAQTRTAADNVMSRVGKRVKEHSRYQNWAGFVATVDAAGLEALTQDPDVAMVQPNRTLTANTRQGVALMNAMTATRNGGTYDGRGVSIAICDTGVDYNHQQLGGSGGSYPTVRDFPNSKVIGGYNLGDVATPNDPSPYAGGGSGHSHGTCCAGTAAGDIPGSDRAAAAVDYVGGVAPGSKIYALKMTAASSGSCDESALYGAWDWCVSNKNNHPDYPILVISTSFGGGRFTAAADSADPAGFASAAAAKSAGISVFCSSGNNGYCDSVGSPAAFSNTVSIGAVYDANVGSPSYSLSYGSCPVPSGGTYTEPSTAADVVCAYSNSSADLLDLFAPSNNNATTTLGNAFRQNFNGTSAACPYAAGAAACLQSASMQISGRFLTPDELQAALVLKGDPVTDRKVPTVTKPRVNLGNAVTALNSSLPPLNDNFSSATVLSGTGSSVFGTNLNGTSESGEPDHGYASVWYKLTVPYGRLTLSGPSSDHLLVNLYAGSSLTGLTPVAQVDKGASVTLMMNALHTEYYLAVTGVNTTDTGMFSFSWSLMEMAPVTLVTPQGGTAVNTQAARTTFEWRREVPFDAKVYVWFAKLNSAGLPAWSEHCYANAEGGMDSSVTGLDISMADIQSERSYLGLAAGDPIYWCIGDYDNNYSAFYPIYSFTPPVAPTAGDGWSSVQVERDGSLTDIPEFWPPGTNMVVQVNLKAEMHVATVMVNGYSFVLDDRVATDCDGSRVLGRPVTEEASGTSTPQTGAGYVKFTIPSYYSKTFSITGISTPVVLSRWELE